MVIPSEIRAVLLAFGVISKRSITCAEGERPLIPIASRRAAPEVIYAGDERSVNVGQLGSQSSQHRQGTHVVR
jgi:hypothetical protein